MIEPEKYTRDTNTPRKKGYHTAEEKWRLLYCVLSAVVVSATVIILVAFKIIGVARVPMPAMVLAVLLMIVAIVLVSLEIADYLGK